jgi:hypothetical protein
MCQKKNIIHVKSSIILSSSYILHLHDEVSSDHLDYGRTAQGTLPSASDQLVRTFRTRAHVPTSRNITAVSTAGKQSTVFSSFHPMIGDTTNLYKSESIGVSQHTQQVPFLTLIHLDPSSMVSMLSAETTKYTS